MTLLPQGSPEGDNISPYKQALNLDLALNQFKYSAFRVLSSRVQHGNVTIHNPAGKFRSSSLPEFGYCHQKFKAVLAIFFIVYPPHNTTYLAR